jgi:dCMP deaminase
MDKSFNNLSDRWKDYFVKSLFLVKELSKDKETQVGAIIIDLETKSIISSGFNGLPRGVVDKENRLTRPDKYMYTIHAELNAILTAQSLGRGIKGKTMLTTLAPCCDCTSIICQTGIREVVSPKFDFSHISCGDGYKASVEMLKESGINFLEFKDNELV